MPKRRAPDPGRRAPWDDPDNVGYWIARLTHANDLLTLTALLDHLRATWPRGAQRSALEDQIKRKCEGIASRN